MAGPLTSAQRIPDARAHSPAAQAPRMLQEPDNLPATRQARDVKDRSAKLQVTGKLAAAIGFMVWAGDKRDDAAAKAGMSVNGLREALRKPHVRLHYTAMLEVLRTSERARNIHALAAVRDDSKNANARVAAVRTLEQIAETGARERPAAPFAGLVVNIVQRGAREPVTIDVEPMRENGDSDVP